MILPMQVSPDRLSAPDSPPLLDAAEVGRLLLVHPKRVYGLPIPRVRLSARRIRWSRADVEAYVVGRRERAVA